MSIANEEQAKHWNSGDEAGHWIAEQERYDRQLEPFADIILDALALQRGERVLDIGCGCGATTLAAARAVAPGQSVGVDLSGPMLERARITAAAAGLTNARFLQADAQVHRFNEEPFDAVMSPFG